MVHKTVLSVDVSCEKCKQEVLSIVSDIEGVNKMEADSGKNTLIVIGEADPYEIITCLRKAGKKAQFVSVGPPPKVDEPKPQPDKPKCTCSCPYLYPYPGLGGCRVCEPVVMMPMNYQDPTPSLCSIM